EVVDFVLKNDIPAIVTTTSMDLELRKEISDKFIVDYIIKNTTKDIDYAVNLLAGLYDNMEIKVLVVDDAVLYRDAMADLAKGHLFKVIEAEDGMDAIEKLEENPDIQVILTDYEMPNMDGIELAQHVRRKYTKDQMAILAISSSEQQDLASLFIKFGANDFIAKPFTKEIFYTRLSSAVENLRLKKTLENVLSLDPVTGVKNRMHFLSKAEKDYKKALKSEENYIVGIIDIDEFSFLNEGYGSKIGDRVLHNVALLMQKATKSRGISARYSADQFIIGMRDLDFETLETYFEYLHKAIDKEKIQLDDGTELEYKISIGVATQPKDTFENFIKSALVMVEMAKEEGGNRVEIEPFPNY
ncbi:MAG: diguanylate cyclase, partial [Campylobacterales bacterium]|nr:diguanylate cyclase [Campylobacterales bacterium]